MEFVLVFLIGLLVGGFLNVVICRIPLKESIVFPGSHCPQCQIRLRWYELIPIVSYVIQKGKCRTCGSSISIRYPLVEFFSACIFGLLYNYLGFNMRMITVVCFTSILIPVVCIDLQYQIIPDKLNLTGGILGLLAVTIAKITLVDALLGAFLGGGIMLLIAVISRGGMGGGDIKMVAWMGLFLGWKMILLSLFLSFITGGLGSFCLIVLGIKKRKDFIPFGPFLAIGGFAAYVFGDQILQWYIARFF